MNQTEPLINHLSNPATLCNKTFLITGCNGFLGRRFLYQLINILKYFEKEGISLTHKIYAIDNGITSIPIDFQFPSFVTYYNDNAITFDYSCLQNVDVVVHMAGLASPAQYKKYPLETIDVAVSLTRKLLDHSIKWAAKFIFFSSSEVYGNPDPKYIPTPEEYKGYVSSMGPRACYDESKRLGETLCYVYCEYFNVHTSVVRPFNIYGPGMHKKDYRMIPNMMRSALEKSTLRIYGDGCQTRTFCYLDDAINGIINVINNSLSGSVYNIGNPKPEISMINLVKSFNEITSAGLQFELVPYPDYYPADEPIRRCPDISKSTKEI
jgi:UDP-glucuronate decarboxylase